MHQRLQSDTFSRFKEEASFQFPLFSFSIYTKIFWRIDHSTGSVLASHFSGSTPIVFALLDQGHSPWTQHHLFNSNTFTRSQSEALFIITDSMVTTLQTASPAITHQSRRWVSSSWVCLWSTSPVPRATTVQHFIAYLAILMRHHLHRKCHHQKLHQIVQTSRTSWQRIRMYHASASGQTPFIQRILLQHLKMLDKVRWQLLKLAQQMEFLSRSQRSWKLLGQYLLRH